MKPLSIIATIFLTMLGSVLAIGGVIASSQATLGTSLVGFACFLGIVARIFQAAYLALPEKETQLQRRENVPQSMSTLSITP